MSQGAHKSFTCPHCKKRFQWTTKIADRKAQCPACAKRIRIPTVPGRVAEAVDPLPDSHKAQAKADSSTYELDLTGIDESVVEPPPTAAQQAAAQTGRCPACNQSINPGAVICVKCGYNLKKGKRLQTAVADEGAPPELPASITGSALASLGSSPIAQALADREGETEASRFIELWLPLGLIVVGLVVRFVEQLYFTGNTATGITSAAIYVGIDLAVTIPILLVAMIIAVKLLDVAFGPLGIALFKLTAVVLGPAAVGAIIGYLLGGGVAGGLTGSFVSFIIYWSLISVLFELEWLEALYLIAIIWVLKLAATLFIINLILALIF